MVMHMIRYSLHTKDFYSIYSMMFERIKSEDDQFRGDINDEDVPQFG